MRKQLLNPTSPTESSSTLPEWLDLEQLADVEITSEHPEHPIESALVETSEHGWLAATAGEQTIRLRFTQPQRLRRVRIEFDETAAARTQEFLLRSSSDGGANYRDVVRQQFHFSPPSTAREVEDYSVELDGVTTVELVIVPDVQRGAARASLKRLQLSSTRKPKD